MSHDHHGWQADPSHGKSPSVLALEVQVRSSRRRQGMHPPGPESERERKDIKVRAIMHLPRLESKREKEANQD
jgi:hypothetical protein